MNEQVEIIRRQNSTPVFLNNAVKQRGDQWGSYHLTLSKPISPYLSVTIDVIITFEQPQWRYVQATQAVLGFSFLHLIGPRLSHIKFMRYN